MLAAIAIQGSVEALPASPAGGRLELRNGPAAVAKCPKYGWEFPFAVEGWAAMPGSEPELRFRVFSQSQKSAATARSAVRMLLRLWEMSKARLRFDHPLAYRSLVEVFLCDGGTAGGEQGIFHYPAGGVTNGIYIYHLDSFTDPVERAREIAHEYGHAVLPNTKGFETPEEWGNGYLGERLYLMWLAESFARAQLVADDLMGADLSEWVQAKAHALADRIWRNGPDEVALGSTGQRAIDEYVAVHLYMWEAFPGALGRGMKLSGGNRAPDSLRGLLAAVDEAGYWEVFLPERHRGKDCWIPAGEGWSVKGGQVLGRKGVWAKVRPAGAKLIVEKR